MKNKSVENRLVVLESQRGSKNAFGGGGEGWEWAMPEWTGMTLTVISGRAGIGIWWSWFEINR